nr:transcriptional repressor LexA [Oleiphilus messinensis]
MKLTKRQSEVLELIRGKIEETGYPPTRAEIATELGFKSANAAEEHVKALARKGAIELVRGRSRGIRLPAEEETQGIPIVGQVAAGNPILATENIEDYCQVPPEFFNPKADYFLRVKGTSMKDAGILDGDLLAVHRTQEARNGQIVVARLEEDVTVKRFKKEGNKVLLIAENEEFDPIEVDLTSAPLVIEGLGVGVIRRS